MPIPIPMPINSSLEGSLFLEVLVVSVFLFRYCSNLIFSPPFCASTFRIHVSELFHFYYNNGSNDEDDENDENDENDEDNVDGDGNTDIGLMQQYLSPQKPPKSIIILFF
jgi:hypothetical protein